ncbi:hypothetical protein V1291_004759 [Nitrobacteraceae bacterium AZCC 1564]
MTKPDENTDTTLEPTAFGRAWSVPKQLMSRWWAKLDEWEQRAQSLLEETPIVPQFERGATFLQHIVSFLQWTERWLLIIAALFVLKMANIAKLPVAIALILFAVIYILPFVFVFRCGRFLYRQVFPPAWPGSSSEKRRRKITK